MPLARARLAVGSGRADLHAITLEQGCGDQHVRQGCQSQGHLLSATIEVGVGNLVAMTGPYGRVEQKACGCPGGRRERESLSEIAGHQSVKSCPLHVSDEVTVARVPAEVAMCLQAAWQVVHLQGCGAHGCGHVQLLDLDHHDHHVRRFLVGRRDAAKLEHRQTGCAAVLEYRLGLPRIRTHGRCATPVGEVGDDDVYTVTGTHARDGVAEGVGHAVDCAREGQARQVHGRTRAPTVLVMSEDWEAAVKAAIDAARANFEDAAMFLEAMDLTHKYGFGDGDLADDVVYDWAEQSWVAELPGAVVEGEYVEHPVNSYCNSRVVLALAIKEVLLPSLTLPTGAFVERISSAHNPFYLIVNGHHVNEETVKAANDPTLTQAHRDLQQAPPVPVTHATVLQLCQRAYPKRPMGWLRLFDQLSWVFDLDHVLPPPVEPILRMSTLRVGAFVDAYAAILDDEILGLASEVLRGGEVVHSLNQLDPSAMLDAVSEALTVAQAAAGVAKVDVPHARAVVAALPRAGLLPAQAPSPARQTRTRARSPRARQPGRGSRI